MLPADEYADKHLPRAINIPLKNLDATSVEPLDRSRPQYYPGQYSVFFDGRDLSNCSP